jgi:thiamine biosynthesis lipoprotein
MTLEAKYIQPRIIRGFFLLLLASLVFSCSQSSEPTVIRLSGPTMGTTYNIVYIDSMGRDFGEEVDSLLIHYNRVMSTYDPESVISSFNKSSRGIRLDSESLKLFEGLIEVSDELYAQTGGAFNIAIGAMVDHWGFYDAKSLLSAEPEPAVLDSLKAISRWEDISLSGDSLIKRSGSVMLDVNAIAPGQACDVIGAWMENNGVERFLIEIGGEIVAKGNNASGGPWVVGIRTPEELSDNVAGTAGLSNRALATSGNYNKYVEIAGTRYGHTIDPRIGSPAATDVLSVTIIAGDCIHADAYATACMVLGLDGGIRLIEGNDDLEGYILFAEGDSYREYASPGFPVND